MTGWLEPLGWALLAGAAIAGIGSVVRYTMRETERRAHLRRLDEQTRRDQRTLEEIRARRRRDGARER